MKVDDSVLIERNYEEKEEENGEPRSDAETICGKLKRKLRG
jgi:hypothetical protein